MAAAATVAAGIPPVVLKPAAVQRQQHTDIASAANSTANGTAGDSWPPADRMIEWIVENGGEVRRCIVLTLLLLSLGGCHEYQVSCQCHLDLLRHVQPAVPQ